MSITNCVVCQRRCSVNGRCRFVTDPDGSLSRSYWMHPRLHFYAQAISFLPTSVKRFQLHHSGLMLFPSMINRHPLLKKKDRELSRLLSTLGGQVMIMRMKN
ncbi:hypothetical protein PMAYCL1PPCAC_27875 [Pristionchus mayeri]|uniref:Uncharacterized protein n=1 Tax=Pristionchus mayeri TaxID=1317129 RepID=A0AAN5D7W0_9BILA|nr:hypothetical protein PMAYCL1PPCAC_27875 [Pristionchus mayeri]